MTGSATAVPSRGGREGRLVRLAGLRRDLETQRLDRLTPGLVSALKDAGVPCIVLKGPTTRLWLYAPGETRPSCDVDLMVPRSGLRAAHGVLRGLGFDKRGFWRVSSTWDRARDGVTVDLHHGLSFVTGSSRRVWTVLRARTVALQVGGGQVPALDVPGRALHLALHHAQSHGSAKSREDLRRAIARTNDTDWLEARDLAVAIGGCTVFTTGLRLLSPEGTDLADRLGLPAGIEPSLALLAGPSATAILNDLVSPGSAGQLARSVAALLDPRGFAKRRRRRSHRAATSAGNGASDAAPWPGSATWGARLLQFARELPVALGELRAEHRRIRRGSAGAE